MSSRRFETWRIRAAWIFGLLVATVAFWKLRIIDAATETRIGLGNLDIFTEHLPMADYGFGKLAGGSVPFWNPYQLTGMPFLAVPHVGLFYPANWIYALWDPSIATELSFIGHSFFAGIGFLLLARLLGWSWLAGFVAASTFMWSGWMTFYANQASLVSGMSWLPITIYLVERTTRDDRIAGIGVAIAVACQVLNGATEFFVYNLYAAGAWTLLRLLQLVRGGSLRTALWRGTGLLAAVAAGVLLASPQLWPSLVLASQSLRGESGIILEQSITLGSLSPQHFFDEALRATGIVTVGVLPLAGIALGFGTRWRAIGCLLVGASVVSALLVFGGDVYAIYFETPIGGLFRRPHKFLHLYAFAQAGLAGLAVGWLEGHVATRRKDVWRSFAFLAAIALCTGGTIWLATRGAFGPPLVALMIGLVLYGAVAPGLPRRVVTLGLVALQVGVSFFGVHQPYARPITRPGISGEHRAVLDLLAEREGDDRSYIDPNIYFLPGLMQKAGVQNRLRVLGGYEPLVSQRAADYLSRTAPPHPPGSPFAGALRLNRSVRWSMFDLSATRYFVVRAHSRADRVLDRARTAAPEGSRAVLVRNGAVRVYERPSALPRARFVPTARFFHDPAVLLDVVASEQFDPALEVLLEAAPSDPVPIGAASFAAAGGESSDARITLDETERVVVEVEAPTDGWLVLADAWNPEWRARVNGRDVKIWPAYHLFRAVPVEAGPNRIEFRYFPQTFFLGLAVSGVTGAVLAGLLITWRRTPSRRKAEIR